MLDEPPVKFPYIPAFALWYLLCMVYWRALVWFIPETILKSWIFLALVLILSIFPSVLNLNYCALSRCISFFPYFLVGWKLRGIDIQKWISGLRKWQILLIMALGVISCMIALRIPMNILWGHEPLTTPIYKILIYKCMAWGVAIINSLCFVLLIPKTIAIKEGPHTLTYYLFHTLLLFPVLYYFQKLLPHNYLITLLVLLISLAVLAIIRRIRFIENLMKIRILSKINVLKRK